MVTHIPIYILLNNRKLTVMLIIGTIASVISDESLAASQTR